MALESIQMGVFDMTIEEQLKQEILSRYKSVRAFTTTIGIPYSTLDSVFKRGISNAGVSTMIKVFHALGLDIESIHDGELRPSMPNITQGPTSEKEPVPKDGGGQDDTTLEWEFRRWFQLQSPERQKEVLFDLAKAVTGHAE